MCLFEGCESKAIAKGYCDKHYRRMKKHGDASVLKNERHGMKNTKVYRSWCHMKERCLNENDPSYKHYGARGISVCDEWVNSFLKFFESMGNPPTSKHQIDRIDNNKGYSPENCRWVLSSTNNQNRRSTKMNACDVGLIRKVDMSVDDIVDKYGISKSQAYRIKNITRWVDIETPSFRYNNDDFYGERP